MHGPMTEIAHDSRRKKLANACTLCGKGARYAHDGYWYCSEHAKEKALVWMMGDSRRGPFEKTLTTDWWLIMAAAFLSGCFLSIALMLSLGVRKDEVVRPHPTVLVAPAEPAPVAHQIPVPRPAPNPHPRVRHRPCDASVWRNGRWHCVRYPH